VRVSSAIDGLVDGAQTCGIVVVATLRLDQLGALGTVALEVQHDGLGL
jgi:hypothetical protein